MCVVCEVKDLEKERIAKAKSSYKKLHLGIMGEIRFMLKTANIEPIHHLANLDPSFTALVEDLEKFRDIIVQLIDALGIGSDDLVNVSEYLSLASSLAESIDSGCSDSLGAAVAALDDKPYI